MAFKYNNAFIELVTQAKESSNNFYKSNDKTSPNPFYIGFGNPNSKVLFIGKEKGFESTKEEQLLLESIKNPDEWFFNISNTIEPSSTKFYKESTIDYNNVFLPYEGPMKGQHTWNSYSSILSRIMNKSYSKNQFLSESFITEVNPAPSKTSQISRFTDQRRLDFLNHEFYTNFPIIVLGCANYLSKKNIEHTFNVRFVCSKSEPRKKLEIYQNTSTILLNTRQLSMDVSREYLDKVAAMTKSENWNN